VLLFSLSMDVRSETRQTACFSAVSVSLSDIQDVEISGVPARVLHVDSPMSLSDAVRYLSLQYPQFQIVNTSNKQVVFEGNVAQEHCVIVLTTHHSTHTIIAISSVDEKALPLAISMSSSKTSRKRGTTVPSWLPTGATLAFHGGTQGALGNFTVIQQVWVLDTTIDSVWSHITDGLRRASWHNRTFTESSGSWYRQHESLHVFVADHQGRIGVYVQHHTENKQ